MTEEEKNLQNCLIISLTNNHKYCIICPKCGPMVELKRHCHNLSRFFISENPYDDNEISSWFQIASGITEVKYSSDLFDDLVMWCGPAIEYENHKSNFHSKLICELTRFSFIWGGLEAYLDTIELPRCPLGRDGKIRRVNLFLSKNYEQRYLIPQYYKEVVSFLKQLLTKNVWYGSVNDIFDPGDCSSKNLIGLKAVYKIRNLFAHGAFHFSEPDEWNSVKPYDIQIIATSSRVVLLTIQMLLIATHYNLNFNVAQLHEDPEKLGVVASEYLQKMHLKKFLHS